MRASERLLMLFSTCQSFSKPPLVTAAYLAFLRPMTIQTRSKSNSNQQKHDSPNKATPEKNTSSSFVKKTRANRGKSQTKTKTTTPSSLSSSAEPLPWYHFFTKGDPEYDAYMQHEWGHEKRGDAFLFEALSLEGAQAGLSWLTILRKREAYRRTFANFEIATVASYTEEHVEQILAQENKTNTREIVVRHRGKIESVIQNAQCIQRLMNEEGRNYAGLDQFLWSFVNDRPILNCQNSLVGRDKDDDKDGTTTKSDISQFPTKSLESIAMSRELKRLGFRFVGPTTCYAFMQNVGMVIDHPMHTPEWQAAYERLQRRPGGYQERKD